MSKITNDGLTQGGVKGLISVQFMRWHYWCLYYCCWCLSMYSWCSQSRDEAA